MYNLENMIIRIKSLKKEKKITNDMLAEKAGIPKGTLNKILGNDTRDPQISNIIKIAEALEVSADLLIYGLEPTAESAKPEIFITYEKLNSLGRERVYQYIHDLLDNPKFIVSDFINHYDTKK